MIKAVIDTNILVSGIISPKASPAKIISSWQQREFILITSEEIIDELKEVFGYSRISKKYNLNQKIIDRYLRMFRAFAEVCRPKEKIKAIKVDPEDNKFLEAALVNDAEFIVSGDRHLLALKDFKGIKIIKAEEFVRIIKHGPT